MDRIFLIIEKELEGYMRLKHMANAMIHMGDMEVYLRRFGQMYIIKNKHKRFLDDYKVENINYIWKEHPSVIFRKIEFGFTVVKEKV